MLGSLNYTPETRSGGYSIPSLGVPADPAHPAKNTDNSSRNKHDDGANESRGPLHE